MLFALLVLATPTIGPPPKVWGDELPTPPVAPEFALPGPPEPRAAEGSELAPAALLFAPPGVSSPGDGGASD